MKTLITTIAFAFMAFVATAQSTRYAGAMKKTLLLLDSARTPEQYQQVANDFERIAQAEKDQWLPAYYASYALLMKAFNSKEVKDIDAICSKADEMLALAEGLNPANSEISTVKSMVLMARMRVDGSRGMTMGPKATQILQEALAQQPAGNPRAMVQMAQMVYYTPPAFGGGKDAGIDMLKKGLEAYETFKPASELDPNWGKAWSKRLLESWSK